MEEVVARMNSDGEGSDFNSAGGKAAGPVTVESLTKVIEDISRLH
jgi:hypothetical protein